MEKFELELFAPNIILSTFPQTDKTTNLMLSATRVCSGDLFSCYDYCFYAIKTSFLAKASAAKKEAQGLRLPYVGDPDL